MGRAGPLRIAGLASHNGTNLRRIDAACRVGEIDAEVVLLVSNNGDSGILGYARDNGIPWRHLSSRTHPDPADLDEAIAATLTERGAEVVFLSGYMKRLGPTTVSAFRDRILNVHPALLPAYGGEGMYGDRVYEAVLAAGEVETGPTVHLVDEEYDHGPVVLQRRMPVMPGDTVATLRDRVRAAEAELALEVVALLSRGELDLGPSGAGTGPALQTPPPGGSRPLPQGAGAPSAPRSA